jgi:hypothetical protein
MNPQPSKWCRRAAVAGAVLMLCSCAHTRLYSEARDKQGQDLKKAWSEVDLNAVVAAERSNLATLLQAEFDTQDKLAETYRDLKLRAILGQNGSAELKAMVDERLATAAGSADAVEDQTVALRNLREINSNIADAADTLETLGLKAPACGQQIPLDAATAFPDWPQLGDATRKAYANGALMQLKEQCDALAKAPKPAAIGGDMAIIAKRLDTERAALGESRKQAAADRKSYDDAVAAYEAAAAGGPAPDARARVDAAAARLQGVLAKLEKTQNALSAKFVTEARLAALEDALKTITTTEQGALPGPESGNAVKALVLFPNLIDSTRSSLADARKPLVAPLLLQRDLEQLKLTAIKRDIAGQQAVIDFDVQLIEVLQTQSRQLLKASKLLKSAPLAADVSLAAALADTKDKSKEAMARKEGLYYATALYLDAVNRLDAKRYKLEYARIGAMHDRALAYAEVNMQQWQALIGASASQMGDFGASGIKAEQVNGLLNTLGILWIGNGVNK